MMRYAKAGAILAATAMLAGCASFPRSAGLQSEVLRNADNSDPEAAFAVYPVTRDFLPVVASWHTTGAHPAQNWLPRRGGPSGRVILSGDTVNIAIWDADPNSLLKGGDEPSVRLVPMTVSTQGTVFVPYVGAITVGGMTDQQAREAVQEAMKSISESAQVQLQSQAGPRHSFNLVSGVNRPGQYPLVERDMSVLSAIALGGGVAASFENPQLRLVRGSQSYTIPVARLFASPDLDATLRAGDRLIVEEEKRHFLALGASGRQETVIFPKDHVTALDAMTLIGGLSDRTADPRGILILREYPAQAVRQDGVSGPERDRVIFTIDLTSADGLFSAGNFAIASGDLVLATESPVGSARTALGLIGSVVGIGNALN